MPQKTEWKQALRWGWLPVVIILGLAARFYVSQWGYDWDLASYGVVVDLMDQGKNIYANTERYNYGPVWFNVLHVLAWLSGHDVPTFRKLLIGLLSAADLGIAWILWRKFGRVAATLFFLNPVSIIISGYQNQFDNVALLFGFLAVLLYGDDFEKPLDRRKFFGLVLLGLSLMTKHDLFAFSLWLAVRQKGAWQKCVVLLMPPLIFLLGFTPYWSEGKYGIIKHVFMYRASPTNYFYHDLIPSALQSYVSSGMLWLLALGLFARICRRRPLIESLLLYLGVMVATSPATSIQYLAIPSAFTAVFVNGFTLAYTLVASLYVISDPEGPHLFRHIKGGDDLAIWLLVIAVVWVVWRKYWLNLVKEFRNQTNAPVTARKNLPEDKSEN